MSNPTTIKQSNQKMKWASLVCSIHCLITPFLLAFAPSSLSGIWFNPFMELGLVVFALSFSGLTLIKGYKFHNQTKAFIPFVFAIILFVASFFLESYNHDIHIFLNLVAGFLLFWALRTDSRFAPKVCSH